MAQSGRVNRARRPPEVALAGVEWRGTLSGSDRDGPTTFLRCRDERHGGRGSSAFAVSGVTIEPKTHTNRSADEKERWPGGSSRRSIEHPSCASPTRFVPRRHPRRRTQGPVPARSQCAGGRGRALRRRRSSAEGSLFREDPRGPWLRGTHSQSVPRASGSQDSRRTRRVAPEWMRAGAPRARAGFAWRGTAWDGAY